VEPLFPYLLWLHVQHFCDTTLHDQKVRIVDVELDGTKQVLDPFVLHVLTIDKVLVFAVDYNLTCHRDLVTFLEADGTLIFIGIVEDQCYRGWNGNDF
jgi:hypothetical protein